MRPTSYFRYYGSLVILMVLLGVGREARAQSSSSPTAATADKKTPDSTGESSTVPATVPPATDASKQTERQKALASQADRLVEMANELKAQVDLTNKNILSLKVVRKAQEIEALAKGMKEQARKGQ